MTEERLEKIEKEGAVSDVVSGGMGGIQHFTVTGFPIPEHAKDETITQYPDEQRLENERSRTARTYQPGGGIHRIYRKKRTPDYVPALLYRGTDLGAGSHENELSLSKKENSIYREELSEKKY